MHTANIAAFAGVGFLAIGTIFSVSDLSLSRTSFELMIGPVLWIVGCALMVAWAIGRVGLAVRRGSGISDQSESGQGKEETEPKRPIRSEAAASGSHKRTVAGQVVADFLVPLAIWLMLSPLSPSSSFSSATGPHSSTGGAQWPAALIAIPSRCFAIPRKATAYVQPATAPDSPSFSIQWR